MSTLLGLMGLIGYFIYSEYKHGHGMMGCAFWAIVAEVLLAFIVASVTPMVLSSPLFKGSVILTDYKIQVFYIDGRQSTLDVDSIYGELYISNHIDRIATSNMTLAVVYVPPRRYSEPCLVCNRYHREPLLVNGAYRYRLLSKRSYIVKISKWTGRIER